MVEQEVKVEIFPEEYKIIETSAPSTSSADLKALDEAQIAPDPTTAPLMRRKFCSTCHHQINKQDPPLKG